MFLSGGIVSPFHQKVTNPRETSPLNFLMNSEALAHTLFSLLLSKFDCLVDMN